MVIEHVSLGQATKNDTRRHCSKKAAAWRAFRRLVAQAVGALAGWRKGRVSQVTLQKSVNLLVSISLLDLGPWDPGWDFPSQEAVAHTLHKAETCGDWASQVTKVMAFVKLHAQQAVNAAAADSARCWRRWAKEACQGSAGAAHGFSKAGLDSGDGEGLAGPQLLVNQMGTWLPLWLDPRRANAKQLADQEDVGEPLPRPSLEEVDNVCKTYKHTAGLGHDCINPKAILQLPVELRVRFIDLLMAFEAKLVKPLNWAHMMVLRPKPSGGHRTIGLTVAPLRVLSRLRRPLAQQWENEHDAPYFWGCQGKACDRAAWAHSIMVAAAKGRQQSAASLLLDLAKFYEHVGHDHLWEEGRKTRFPTRLLACWCASYEGWRFLEADKCATFPFWAFGTILPGCSGAYYRRQTHAGNSPGNSSHTPPELQAMERGRRHFGACGGHSQDGASPHCRGGQASGGRTQGARFAALRRKVQSPHRRSGQAQACALLQQLETLGIDESNSARNVGADLQLGRRRRALVVKGRLARATKRTKRVRQLRKAGAHTGKLTLTGSNAGVLWGSEVLGFTPTQLHAIRVDAAKATYRLNRGQNAATTMLANAQSSGGKNIDPAFRHHRLVILAWATGVWEGTPDLDTMQAALRGSLARLSRLKRPWCGATDAAATFVLTLLRLGWSAQSARHLTTHDGTKIDLLAVAPRTVGFWVDQASLRWSDSSAHWDQSKGPLFWEAIRPLLGFGKLEGWSLWHRNVLVKLVSRGIWTQERLARLRGEVDGSCQLCNDGPGTMFHRCYECPALQTERDMYVSQEVRAAARAVDAQYREQFAHGIFPDPGAILPAGFPERQCQVFWHNRPPDGLLEGHIFTDGSSSGSGALRRAGWAVVAVDDVGNLKAAAYGAVPSDVLPGQSARDGEDYAAAMAGQFAMDPLTLYIDCEGTIATVNGPKHKALGARGPRAHVWNRLLCSHDEVKAVKVKGHATLRDVEDGRTSHLFKKGNDLADTFAKKGADTHKPAFRVAKTFAACASLAKQAARWAAEAHVLLRFRGWNDTRAAAPRSRVRPPRARLKRKADKETAAPAAGQVSDWLSPTFPSRFSQDSHLDPRSFRGHSLQLGRVFDAGGRALDNAIIFCAKCGAVYWERADALVPQLQRNPRGQNVAAAQIEVGNFSQQALHWLDS